MKRLLCLLISIILSLGMVSCSDNKDDNDTNMFAALWLLLTNSQSKSVEISFKVIDSDSKEIGCDSNFTVTQAVNGSTTKSLALQDLRFYISDIYLIGTDGSENLVTLSNDGVWQYSNAVLLDFENKSTGTLCGNTGTSDTNTKATGTISSSATSDFKGVKFTLGLPYSLNKLSNSTSPSPFNISAMYWSWANGYKFTKIEFADQSSGSSIVTSFHIGSTGCTESSIETADCSKPYRSTITLTQDSGFTLSSNYIALDMNELLKNFDTGAASSIACMPFGKPSGSTSSAESAQCPRYSQINNIPFFRI